MSYSSVGFLTAVKPSRVAAAAAPAASTATTATAAIAPTALAIKNPTAAQRAELQRWQDQIYELASQAAPLAPYPPITNGQFEAPFPLTGDPSLFLNAADVTDASRAEAGLMAAEPGVEAKLRRPKLSWPFWAGITCAGAAWLLSRK